MRKKPIFVPDLRLEGLFYQDILLNFSAELLPRKEIKERILTSVGAAPIKCRLHHKTLEVVADLAESMAGLRFSYGDKLVLPR